MKADRRQIERALDAPPAGIRLFFLYGPDESGSRALAARLAAAMGPDAERIDLTGATLKADPARLADEAAAISMFGGPRHIRIEPAGDEVLDALDALFEAPAAGNPAVLIAGALRKESRLLKRVLAEPAALACASYLPEGDAADQVAIALGRPLGLRIRPDIARRLATACGGDRAILAQELAKFAAYLDAAPDRPRDLEHDALDALGADSGDGDLSRLVDLVLGGQGAEADAETARLAGEGIQGITVLRALLRRLLLLAELRAKVDEGASIDTAMASGRYGLFGKNRASAQRQLARWDSAGLATAIERVASAERAIKAAHSPGPILAGAELLAIGRAAARRR